MVLVVSLEDAPATERLQAQLRSLEFWLNEMSESSQCRDEEMSFILIGNKADRAKASRKACPCDTLLRDWCQS